MIAVKLIFSAFDIYFIDLQLFIYIYYHFLYFTKYSLAFSTSLGFNVEMRSSPNFGLTSCYLIYHILIPTLGYFYINLESSSISSNQVETATNRALSVYFGLKFILLVNINIEIKE